MPWLNDQSTDLDPGAISPSTDRRIQSRRQEDYFWLAQLGDMSEQALIVFDPNFNLEFANTLTLSLFGITQEELSSLKTYQDFIEHCVVKGDFGESTQTALKAFAEDLRANSEFFKGKNITEHQISTPSGKHLCLRQSYGRDRRMLLAIRDVTEQVEADQALELALKIGASGYGTYNFETQEGTFHGNTLKDFLGVEMYNQKEADWFKNIIHDDDWPKVYEAWKNCIKNKSDVDLKIRFVGPQNRSKWFRCYGVPKVSENNYVTSILVYYIDITEEVKLHHDQIQSISKTQATLKARNDFLARLSHEVRTPLNAVIGISDALIHHNADPEILPKLELIQNSAEKIIRIVDETLDHSKMEEDKVSLDPSPTDPAKCVDTVFRLWQEKAASSNVTLTCRIDKSVPKEVIMDGFRYEQCINNLISNAIKFTSGGTVNVVLTALERKTNSQLVLAVKDNGIGMTPEQQKEIFMPYTQANSSIARRYGGTGLGMSITKNITELMGGTIKVKSQEGQGTIFIIGLPYKTQQNTNQNEFGNKETGQLESSQTVSSNALEIPHKKIGVNNASSQILKNETQNLPSVLIKGEISEIKKSTSVTEKLESHASTSLVGDILKGVEKKKTAYSDLRILVVDDNETNHLVVKSLLDSVVGEIITANDGQQAIDSLDVENVDLVLMDIHMPVMDGIEATLAIRSSDKPYKNLPIIALTADPQYQQKRLCKNIGMNEALAKPVKLTELLKAFDSIREDLPENNAVELQRSA